MIHLTYGGSTAARTLACPGWVKKSEGIPRRPAGQAAIDGSMHHEVQEKCQRDDVTPGECLGLSYREGDVIRIFTANDLPLSEIAHAATQRLLDELDIDEIEVEPFVQLEPGVAGGSIDLLGLSADGETLLVLDYKFGRVAVPVAENKQLKFYTIAAEFDAKTKDMFKKIERVVFAVIQPQSSHDALTWTWENPDFAAFEKEVRGAMASDTVTPGSHCHWCPAAPYCAEKRGAVMGTNLLGKDLQKNLQASADMVTAVENWLKAVREELYLQASRGVSVAGWKIVNKRPTRKWIDHIDAMKALMKTKKLTKKELNKTTMLTPAQVEKLVKSKDINIDLSTFIISESSGTTLATADSKAEAVMVSDTQGHLAEIMK
tara:strand:- start:717 stop:1841 length:1125 start_codon:yes stop_codon:yes gene_type:complete